MSAVPQLVRTKCLTCKRSLLPRDLLAGLCPDCLIARLDNAGGGDWLEMLSDKRHCMECSQPFGDIGAYRHWDAVARTFYLLCIPCSEKAIAKAGQYRGTPFGYMRKAQ